MKKAVIILAGGEGLRAGGGEPKQFRMLCGKPVLWWSMKAFHDEDPNTQFIVVIHPNYIYEWEETMAKMNPDERFDQTIVCGGKSRWHSVYNALIGIIPEDDLYIAVHDGARPLIDPATIAGGWKAAIDNKAAIPVIPLSDSIRKLTSTGSSAVTRRDYVAVQTPQVFQSHILKKAYSLPEREEFTDDASVVEASGKTISLYEGSSDNIKITYPQDLMIARIIKTRRDSK